MKGCWGQSGVVCLGFALSLSFLFLFPPFPFFPLLSFAFLFLPFCWIATCLSRFGSDARGISADQQLRNGFHLQQRDKHIRNQPETQSKKSLCHKPEHKSKLMLDPLSKSGRAAQAKQRTKQKQQQQQQQSDWVSELQGWGKGKMDDMEYHVRDDPGDQEFESHPIVQAMQVGVGSRVPPDYDLVFFFFC